MPSKLRVGTAGVVAAAMLAMSAVVAVPAAYAGPGTFANVSKPASVELVRDGKRWRGDRWRRGHWRGGGCWNCGRPGWWGPGIGFSAGVVVGSLLTTPRYYAPRAYYAPRPVYRGYAYSSRDALCARKYRSYNPVTNTYVGYDGRRHYCRL